MIASSNKFSAKPGDLVTWKDLNKKSKIDEYAVVLEVRSWGSIRPEEVFIKFPLDGAEGWYLTSSLNLIENKEILLHC